MSKERLDNLLVKRGLCESRNLAQKLIRAGKVKVKQQIIDKPALEIDLDSEIEIKEKPLYVSRGGEKLAKALDLFPITIKDRICLDGGISTGGFTDCLLQKGAKKVYGVDVGYGQVAWNLRQDSRVILSERTNFRYLTFDTLYKGQIPADLAVMDLSFISLNKVLATLWQLLIESKDIILLVKPQFEVGKEKVGKKGVVRDTKYQAQAIFEIVRTATNLGWQYQNLTWSPLLGPAGNIEYLLWLNVKSNCVIELKEIEFLTQRACQELKSEIKQ